MEDVNPYQAPDAEVDAATIKDGDFSHLNFKQLKKLYARSQNITAITGLIVIAAIFFVVASFINDVDEVAVTVIMLLIAVLYIVTAVGLIKRNQWGRRLGIGICCLSLLNIPIGTLIGLAGLFAFFKAPELFGPDRVTHKAIKEEVKYRKQNKLTK